MREKRYFSHAENNPRTLGGFPTRSRSLSPTPCVAVQSGFLQRGQRGRGVGSHRAVEKAAAHPSQATQAACAVVSHGDRVNPRVYETDTAPVSPWSSSPNPQASIRQTPTSLRVFRSKESQRNCRRRGKPEEKGGPWVSGGDGLRDRGRTLGDEYGCGNEVWTSIAHVPGPGHKL